MLIVNGFEMFGYNPAVYGLYSMHATYIFNTFVMLQIFNFMNCRMIHDELNIFSNITKAGYFLPLVGLIFTLQIIFLTFTGPAIRVV